MSFACLPSLKECYVPNPLQVASHYYSYSFEPNPNWSQKYPLQPEILTYLNGIATKYDVGKHVKFHSIVAAAHWDDSSATWLVTVKDLNTMQIVRRRCRISVSAVGVLSIPKECDIPGASAYKGRLFHTANWDHSFDWKDKEMIVIGLYSFSQVLAHPHTLRYLHIRR